MTNRTLVHTLGALAAASLAFAAYAEPRVDTRPSPFTYEALGATPTLQLKPLKSDGAVRADSTRSATDVQASKVTPLIYNPAADTKPAAPAAKDPAAPAVKPAAAPATAR